MTYDQLLILLYVCGGVITALTITLIVYVFRLISLQELIDAKNLSLSMAIDNFNQYLLKLKIIKGLVYKNDYSGILNQLSDVSTWNPIILEEENEKPKTRNPENMFYIVRIDSRSTHGYQVRIPLDKIQHTLLFSDKQHKGKKFAKNLAIRYRDRLVKKHGLSVNRRRTREWDSRNKTGKVGVTEFWRQIGEYLYLYYIASWSPIAGKPPKRKAFNAHILGPIRARKEAIRFREQKEFEIKRAA